MGVSNRSAKAVKAERVAAAAKAKKKTASKKATKAVKAAPAAAPRAARAPRVKGAERAVVYLGCINGALQTKSTGECFDVAPFLLYRIALLNDAGDKELERLRAPVFAALKSQVVASGAAGGASRALGAATAALYVETSSESEGGEETPRGATPASPAAPAAAAPTAAIGGAGGAAIAAAGISAGLVAFRALMADKPPGVALTPKQEAQAARVEELVRVITSALGDLVREVLGLLIV
ncbi:hypothetical protein ACEPPN_018898 [Leptodophora sp. 'Broadleaf-Isolate-01']